MHIANASLTPVAHETTPGATIFGSPTAVASASRETHKGQVGKPHL
ncbi:MAG: hypothetical protein HWQ23_20825 [Nostoc sp. JL33]|nr:hypothetical protein [Nostoc sp. JL33]MBN3872624.1 hypothetical protein [Nostoc sp. JL33]